MQVRTLRKLETLYALFLIFRQSFFIKGKETEAVIERCSVKKVFLEISQNVQENNCATVSFWNKVVGLRAATLFKKGLRHRCFPVNFVKFLKTHFLTEHLR